jgi:hypothetical protein
MNRCLKLAAALLLGALAVLSLASQAQSIVRNVPKDVVRGRLVVTQPPVVTLDGKPDRLSPGARIRGTNNMRLLSGSVVGQSLPVLYKRDAAGLIHEAWVLTAEEDDKLADADGLQGHQRFAELLAFIFGARAK